MGRPTDVHRSEDREDVGLQEADQDLEDGHEHEHDERQHAEHSGEKLDYFDPQTSEQPMSAPELPDFDQTLRLGRGRLDAAELAECHGLLCGLVCRESSLSAGDYLQHLSAMRLVVVASKPSSTRS